MTHKIELQNVTEHTDIPTIFELNRWVNEALTDVDKSCELTARIVDKHEIQALNFRYRKKNKPTNILSFQADLPEVVELSKTLLGDLIICADIVKEKSVALGIPERDHWAHLIVHGCLHLLGFDHIDDGEALEMEAKETAILANLNIPDPYAFDKESSE